MRRLAVVPIVLLIAATACGPRAIPAGDGGSGTTPSGSSSARASGSATPKPGASMVTGSRPSSSAHPSAGPTWPEPTPTFYNTMPLTLTLSRTCVSPGQPIDAMAKTLAGSKLAFAAYYLSDGNYVPDIHYVPSEGNLTGEYTWHLVLRPDTPLGKARLTVVAAKDSKRGASAEEGFTVARSC